jgi:hypothetical protein
MVGHHGSDSCDQGVSLADGAENGVACALLGSHVHFFAVLLVDERDGDVLSRGDETVIGEEPLTSVTKDNVTNVNLLGPARVPRPGSRVVVCSHDRMA